MEFYNIDKINGLKQKIVNALVPLINSDYVLLDVPNYRNIGDNLIWQGELDFLREYVPYRQMYSANNCAFRADKVPPGTTILLQGGGNFGDIYLDAQEFRETIIRRFPQQRIIIFPQTIFYHDKALLAKDAEVFNSHPDLYICLRDTASVDTLKEFMSPEKLILLPDMAFCMDLRKYVKDVQTGKTLIMQRMDKEVNDKYNLEKIKALATGPVDVKDWPTYNYSALWSRYLVYAEVAEKRLTSNLVNMPILSSVVNPEFGLKSRRNRKRYVELGIDFMNEYDKVITTRLHGLILAVLLNKEVVMLDNSYGKLKGFYDAWLSDFKGIEILS